VRLRLDTRCLCSARSHPAIREAMVEGAEKGRVGNDGPPHRWRKDGENEEMSEVDSRGPRETDAEADTGTEEEVESLADRSTAGLDKEVAIEAEAGPAAEQDDEVSLEVRQLRAELDVLNDRHLRLAAEYDNYRRRSQAQLMDSGVRAQANLVESLLEALDDFGRVTSVDPEVSTVESVLEGVVLVERKLFRLLEEAGLEELNPAGSTFDPNEMEAMARMPAQSAEEDDMVDDVFQKGFRFRGRLVRPARVSVRKFE